MKVSVDRDICVSHGQCEFDAVGTDGLIELGRVPRREVGTKVNHIRNYASAGLPTAPQPGSRPGPGLAETAIAIAAA